MKVIKLKTNINCGGCIASVTPFLNANPDIKKWEVDTISPQKVLTVQTEHLEANDVKSIVQKAGFKAEILQEM
ncbi:heavy-metal-associated domain-containing protein [Emticicia sp.]|uniref:heavy-metal-associated domain-containing protein n=1 Tax=Emticicia sp. TaxID=1930953 RepID=UPI0037516A4C